MRCVADFVLAWTLAPGGARCGNVEPVWLLAVPLLAAVIGVVGGSVSGRVRSSMAVGLLAGSIMLLMYVASTVVLVVVL